MSKTVYFKKNQVILKEGELSFEAYIIDEGEVEVSKAGYGYLATLKKTRSSERLDGSKGHHARLLVKLLVIVWSFESSKKMMPLGS